MLANVLRHPVRSARSAILSWIKSIKNYRFLRSLGFCHRTAWWNRRANLDYLRRPRLPPIRTGLVARDLEIAARPRSLGRASDGSKNGASSRGETTRGPHGSTGSR
jgi:hypothetical protein